MVGNVGWTSSATRITAIALAGLAMAGVSSADDQTLAYGLWSVESRGFGWPCRIEVLEIRESNKVGEATLIGSERGVDGELRPVGSGRVDTKAGGPPASRWFSASWPSGPASTLVQLRPEPGDRMIAVVRERSKDPSVGDKVRQLVLSRALSDVRPVVDGLAPRPNPAGKVLRFDSDGSGSARVPLGGVFVARADGTESRAVALPDGFASATFPCWSPDGKWVAFAAFDASGRNPMIRVAPASGGPSTAVASGTTPTWSRDGSKIAYVASGRADFATDWSSLGRNDERVEAVTLRGSKAGEVETLAKGIWPKWSPTDDRLAFVGRAESNWDVYVRSPDGLGLVRLTDDPALDTQPVWTLDGRSIVFLSDRGNRWDLHRVSSTDRTRLERLSDHSRREDNPSLSPDGRRVAFNADRNRPGGSIQILDLDRGTVRTFPEHSDGDQDPAWSPDGGSIAFISRRPGPLLPRDGRP